MFDEFWDAFWMTLASFLGFGIGLIVIVSLVCAIVYLVKLAMGA